MSRRVLRSRAIAATTLVLIGGIAALAPASAPTPGLRVDMRVLVLANDAGDPNMLAWETNLRRAGVPFDRITGETTLTEATFAVGDRAKYQGVVVSGPDGTAGGIPAAFSLAEFELLRAFERKFGIRQMDVNAYPGPPLGLNFPGAIGTMDGQTATLTAAGLAQFPALQGRSRSRTWRPTSARRSARRPHRVTPRSRPATRRASRRSYRARAAHRSSASRRRRTAARSSSRRSAPTSSSSTTASCARHCSAGSPAACSSATTARTSASTSTTSSCPTTAGTRRSTRPPRTRRPVSRTRG